MLGALLVAPGDDGLALLLGLGELFRVVGLERFGLGVLVRGLLELRGYPRLPRREEFAHRIEEQRPENEKQHHEIDQMDGQINGV